MAWVTIDISLPPSDRVLVLVLPTLTPQLLFVPFLLSSTQNPSTSYNCCVVVALGRSRLGHIRYVLRSIRTFARFPA